jgi:hypothetical protein
MSDWPDCQRCGEQPSDIDHIDCAVESTWDDDEGRYVAETQVCTHTYLCFFCCQATNLEAGHRTLLEDDERARAECFRLRFNPRSLSYRPELLN